MDELLTREDAQMQAACMDQKDLSQCNGKEDGILVKKPQKYGTCVGDEIELLSSSSEVEEIDNGVTEAVHGTRVVIHNGFYIDLQSSSSEDEHIDSAVTPVKKRAAVKKPCLSVSRDFALRYRNKRTNGLKHRMDATMKPIQLGFVNCYGVRTLYNFTGFNGKSRVGMLHNKGYLLARQFVHQDIADRWEATPTKKEEKKKMKDSRKKVVGTTGLSNNLWPAEDNEGKSSCDDGLTNLCTDVDTPPSNSDGQPGHYCTTCTPGLCRHFHPKQENKGKLSHDDDSGSDSDDRTVPMSDGNNSDTNISFGSDLSDRHPQKQKNQGQRNILPQLSSDEYESLPDSGNPAAHDHQQYNGYHNDTTDSDSDYDSDYDNMVLYDSQTLYYNMCSDHHLHFTS